MATDFTSIMAQIEAAQAQANKQNQQQYQQMIDYITKLSAQVGQQGTFGQAEQLVNQIGGAARTNIAQQAQQAQAQAEQDLISRGLSSTTIRSAVRRGISADEQKALQAQTEAEAAQKAGLLTQRAGAEMGIGNLMLSALQSRQTQGPDLGMYTDLIKAAAAADKATPAGGRATVSSGGTLPGPGFVTQYEASKTGGGGGSGGGGGLSQQGAGGPVSALPKAEFQPAKGGTMGSARYGLSFMDALSYATSGGGGGGGTTGPSGFGAYPGQGTISATVGGMQYEMGAKDQKPQLVGAEEPAEGELVPWMGPEGSDEYFTDYNEYKAWAGNSAVSPMYFEQVYHGRYPKPKGGK